MWTQKANVPGSARWEATGLSIGNYGYLGTGYTPLPQSDFYQYNPLTNMWTSKANFGGGVRVENVSFSIGSLGYLGTGWDGTNFRNDFWEYHPEDSTTGISNLHHDNDLNVLDFKVYPNPAKEFIVISSESGEKKNLKMKISDVNGKIILLKRISFEQSNSTITLKDFSKGIYFMELSDGKEKGIRKFLKE